MKALVTRPREDADALAAALAARGVTTLIEPMLRIETLPDAAPALDAVQAVLVTSANGARALAAATSRRDLAILAVGEASAERARRLGFYRVESAEGDVAALARLAAARLDPAAGPLLHAAGREVAGDLVDLLAPHGFAVQRSVLYRAEPVAALSPLLIHELDQGALDFAFFFSPRTAATFARLLAAAGRQDACRSLVGFCLSPAVAERIAALPWRAVHTAARPTQTELLARLDVVLADLRPAADDARGTRMGDNRRSDDTGDTPHPSPPTKPGDPPRDLPLPGVPPADGDEDALRPSDPPKPGDPPRPLRPQGADYAAEQDAAPPPAPEEAVTPEPEPAAAPPRRPILDADAEPVARENAVADAEAAPQRPYLDADAHAPRTRDETAPRPHRPRTQTGEAFVSPPPSSAPRARSGLGWLAPAALLLLLVLSAPFWAAPLAALLPWGAAGGRDAERLAAIEQRLAALENRGQADVAALRQSVEALGQRMARLDERSGETANLAAGLRQLEQRLAERPAVEPQRLQAIEGDLRRVALQVNEISQRLAAAEGREARDAGVERADQALLLALGQLRDAALSGRPYAAELGAVKALARERAEIVDALQPLEAMAATGVATPTALAQRFDAAAADIAAAEARPPDDWQGRALASLRSIVSIRRVGERAQAGPEAAVAAAETALADGDVAGAVAALETLQGAAAEKAKPWLDAARARLAAEAALTRAQAAVVQRLGENGSQR